MPSQPGKRGESLLGAEALLCLPVPVRGQLQELPQPHTRDPADGTPGWCFLDGSQAASASSCLSCPIPAALLRRGLRGRAGLCLGRRGEPGPARCILKTLLKLPRAQGWEWLPAPDTAEQFSGGLCSSAKEKEPELGLFGSHSWLLQEPHWVRQTSQEKVNLWAAGWAAQ